MDDSPNRIISKRRFYKQQTTLLNMIKKQELKKKRATKREIEELRNIVIEVQKDHSTMAQIKKLITQTA